MIWGLETSLARYSVLRCGGPTGHSVVRCWRGTEQSEGLSIQGRDMADIEEKGWRVEKEWRLYHLCKNKENKFDEIRDLLDDLSEDERRDVVNYREAVVSES